MISTRRHTISVESNVELQARNTGNGAKVRLIPVSASFGTHRGVKLDMGIDGNIGAFLLTTRRMYI